VPEKIEVYPLLCKCLLKEKIWGGRKLVTLFDFALPIDAKIGEAWIVADLPEGTSSIINGPLGGKTLSHITQSWGHKLIGTAWNNTSTDGRFPLLIKYLDACDDLSVQVHPDEESCQRYFPKEFSKDESWIILDAEPNGMILHGFNPEVTLQDFDRLLSQDRVIECMRHIKVSRGEVYRLEPGTVHSICKGVALLEIQEPSDSTFRIFDYNRLGEDGKPRALHIQEARKVMRFGDSTPPQIQPQKTMTSWGEHELLVDVPAYRIERISITRPFSWNINPVSMQVLILLDGSLSLQSTGDTLNLRKGDGVILPATLGKVDIKLISCDALGILTGAGRVPMIH